MFGALGVVVVLVAGLAVWLMRSPGPVPNLEPFEAAVAALDTAHAVHYRSSAAGGAMEWDVRVTRRGEAVGTATVAGQQFDVLAVDGRTFVKLPADLLPRLSSSTPVEALKGKWITGSGVASGGMLGPLARQLRSPGELSRDLRAALDDATAVPTTGDPGTVVDGVSALAVDPPAGRLFVTKDATHRVLRLARAGAGARSSLSFLPSLSAVLTVPALPAQQGPSSLSHGAAVWLAGAARPQALPGPENGDIDVQFGTASVHCSAAGCSISVPVTASSTGGGGHLSDLIDVTLTGSFTIEGRPAGTCTSVSRLMLRSGGRISCHSPEAGVVFAQVDGQKRTQAQAQANAKASETPGVQVSVPYEVAVVGKAYVTARSAAMTAQVPNGTVPSTRNTQPTYQLGASDGGPGTWVQSPRRSGGVEYQKKVTGAPEGVEYAVPASTKSGRILFDGYKDGKLIDAKDWKTWPPANEDFWKKGVLEEARAQVKAAKGTPVEWHISTKEKAGLVRALLRENKVQGLSVKGP